MNGLYFLDKDAIFFHDDLPARERVTYETTVSELQIENGVLEAFRR